MLVMKALDEMWVCDERSMCVCMCERDEKWLDATKNALLTLFYHHFQD